MLCISTWNRYTQRGRWPDATSHYQISETVTEINSGLDDKKDLGLDSQRGVGTAPWAEEMRIPSLLSASEMLTWKCRVWAPGRMKTEQSNMQVLEKGMGGKGGP